MSRQHAIAALVFAALALGFTWPLALNLGRAVAEPGDAFLVIWILDWDWWATLHQPLSLFHANMLYPAKYSLAFTENLYGIALLLFPFRAVGVGPIVAYNLAVIAGLALAGFGAYLLGRRLTRSFEAGLAAGIFFAFARINFTHLQHIWSGWLPLMLVALLDYAERPSRKRAALFAALVLINGLTNIHYFLFGTFAIAVTALLLVPRRELLIAVAAALLLLAPFLYPYAAFAKLYNLQRTYAESVGFSATPSDWIASKAAESERHVAPGALALLAAGAAFVLARKQWPKLALATLWIAIGFAGSLGMNFEFHRFLFGAVPGFRAIRVPARWSVIAYVGLAILIALTTAAIARRFRWLMPLAFAIALWQAPIRWYMARPFPEVYRWLATTRGPIAELPMGNYAEYEYHLYSTSHHLPSVNGSAGTPVRRKLNEQWSQTPLPDDFLDTLANAGVEHLILHADLLGARSPDVREWLKRELDRGRLSFVNDFANGAEGDWVFRLGGLKPAAPLPEHAARFLAGAATCSRSIFGVLETPLPRRYARGLEVKGWSISPHGIRSAFVYFNNRTIRYPLPITRDIGTRCWYYAPQCHAHYRLAFAERPKGVWRDTDVQVDVTDAKGNVWTSDNRWFAWERRRPGG
ncbi:MAG TPA: hypothetical protein VKB93_01170 [Thermoanaerobaculia bacterium]|nr:hypothetical protein [Thermoanaerobaculia bacterium]